MMHLTLPFLNASYELRLFNKGYFGEGKYNPDEFSIYKVCYDKWRGMLTRCYDDEYQQKYPTYNGVTVCDLWLNLQEYGKWFEDNYYEVDGELMELDKAIKSRESKIYKYIVQIHVCLYHIDLM